jgi:transposase
MDEIVEESVELVERVCAIDIAKADLVACVRVPHETKPGRRLQEIREYSTLTAALLGLADWLRCQRVQLVAMEVTSDYWKPVYYLLEAEGFECWLLNAKHVKNVPGRPETDRLDAVRLAKVVERGMCRPSFVPPKPIGQLRDLTRYRRSLVRERCGCRKSRPCRSCGTFVLVEDAAQTITPTDVETGDRVRIGDRFG